MYYVYEWYIVETGEVIYVGKGIRQRYKVRKHNKFFNDMLKRFECKSRIVKEFEDERDAFAYEFERIKELKEQGQCVCNIYNGGTGGTTAWWTDERKQWYSDHNAMKSEQQRKRMAENNPMKDKSTAEKTNAKKRRAVIIGDVEYNSVKTVMDKYGVSFSVVSEWCKHGFTKSGEPCRYADTAHAEAYSLKNNGSRRIVIYNGNQYESATALARHLGIAQTSVSRWCRNGVDSSGIPCRYLDDKREHISATHRRAISILVNGVRYSSKEAASRALGISVYLLTQYLSGKRKDTKYICEYDNQQPSRGKSDNSTPEGSTTNG